MPITFSLSCWFDPLQQQLQPRPVHLSGVHLGPIGNEAPNLELFRPYTETGSVKVQDLHLGRSFGDVNKQVAAQWVLP
jgi:hypothetical protein